MNITVDNMYILKTPYSNLLIYISSCSALRTIISSVSIHKFRHAVIQCLYVIKLEFLFILAEQWEQLLAHEDVSKMHLLLNGKEEKRRRNVVSKYIHTQWLRVWDMKPDCLSSNPGTCHSVCLCGSYWTSFLPPFCHYSFNNFLRAYHMLDTIWMPLIQQGGLRQESVPSCNICTFWRA